jgi:hypothetical protein
MKQTGRSIACAVVVAVLVGSGLAWAADDTTGTITIESKSLGLGLGYTWGEGVLQFRGRTYPFTVTGFSVGDVGLSRTFAKGEVYNLKSVDDFSGLFMAAEASATLGGGAGATAMRNQRNVQLVWTATNQGLRVALAPTGLELRLGEALPPQASGGQPAAAPRPTR